MFEAKIQAQRGFVLSYPLVTKPTHKHTYTQHVGKYTLVASSHYICSSSRTIKRIYEALRALLGNLQGFSVNAWLFVLFRSCLDSEHV